MNQYVINTADPAEIQSELKKVTVMLAETKVHSVVFKKDALVIAGEALTKIQEDNKELKEAFLNITDTMDVVIACRVSPK